jgi:hemerythrin superfamily protein
MARDALDAIALLDALDAIALLKADHREVEELFGKAEKEEPGSAGKQTIVQEICQALTTHANMEEDIAYPAFRQAGVTSSIMDEAAVEHVSFEQLVDDLQGMHHDDEQYDATVKVLSEYVKHHVREEEEEMFPQVKSTDADIKEIGRRLVERKRKLMKRSNERPAA